MTNLLHIRLASPMPCGIFNGTNPNMICGRPAYVIEAQALFERNMPSPIGRYVVRPICEECVAGLVKLYGLDVPPPEPQWLSLSSVSTLAAELEPAKYAAVHSRTAAQRWREVIMREGWEGKGLATKDGTGHWVVLRTAVIQWVEARRGKYL